MIQVVRVSLNKHFWGVMRVVVPFTLVSYNMYFINLVSSVYNLIMFYLISDNH